MSIAHGIISFHIEPGKKHALIAPAEIRLIQATLGDELVDQKRSSIKLHVYRNYDDDEDDEDEEKEEDDEDEEIDTVVIANLIPGVVEAQMIDLVLTEGEKVVFESTGKNTLYIVGNVITQPGLDDQEPSDSELDEDELEGEFDDSEIEAMDDEERNALLESLIREEKEEKKANSKKRAAEEPEPAKAATKKQKAEGGKAVVKAKETAAEKKEAEKPKKEKETKAKETAEKKPEKKADATKKEKKTFTTPGGVKVTEDTVGSGVQAKKGKRLSMRYILKLANGKVVDRNTSGKPFQFVLGAGEVIKGWDEGLAGMQVGGERTLVVPPALGYGKKNSGPIPGNSTLYFEVKLLDVK